MRVHGRGALLAALAAMWGATLVAAVPSPGPAAGRTPHPTFRSAPPSESGAPTRLMIVGDSVSQGDAGDWTWRYRLARHLSRSGAEVDLVGPANDLREGGADYVNPAFDTDHAARWGATLTFPTWPGPALAAYAPEVVVMFLGLNDLVWLELSPTQVLDQMRVRLQTLRQGTPGVDVVLVRLPQTDRPGVPEVNAGLVTLAAEEDTAEERVVVASADAGFQAGRPGRPADTYDGMHPSSRGEVRIAAAVADALAGLGIGEPYPRPLPRPALGPRWPAEVDGVARDSAFRVTWTSAPGTTGEAVWLRDLTTGDGWRRATGPLPSGDDGHGSARVWGLVNRHRYEVRLHPVKGWLEARDTRSEALRLIPIAPAPTGLRVTALRGGARVVWQPTRDTGGYVVLLRRHGAARWVAHSAAATRLRLTGLRGGVRYDVAVHALRFGVRSARSDVRQVVALPR